ncbi:response regulator [Pontiellaceae bacterium B1224]|nr:response regulator [Pontiellaceae bacterium B1224]
MKKVLLIDDDVFLTSLYTNLLQREGLEVDVVNSGTDALTRLPAFLPDVVVLDLHMPGMHGVDLLRSIRNDARFQQLPVIIFATGYLQSLISEVGDLGVYKVFSKMKCKPRVLVAEIKELLESLKQAHPAPETVPSLEDAIGDKADLGEEQLISWLQRLKADPRTETRRVCLRHLYGIVREKICTAMELDELSPEGSLGRALKKLLDDLYNNPDLIRDSTLESLEQALRKVLAIQVTSNTQLESEAMLQDLLKKL